MNPQPPAPVPSRCDPYQGRTNPFLKPAESCTCLVEIIPQLVREDFPQYQVATFSGLYGIWYVELVDYREAAVKTEVLSPQIIKNCWKLPLPVPPNYTPHHEFLKHNPVNS